ncbi:hypothetical protein, partial [Arthrobacter sp. ISL-28]|uniref:hypothetical protein n=1 Tax=Arthrobacter sp. ISL-28 TaxID=2819108 RepID=UPI001BEC1D53
NPNPNPKPPPPTVVMTLKDTDDGTFAVVDIDGHSVNRPVDVTFPLRTPVQIVNGSPKDCSFLFVNGPGPGQPGFPTLAEGDNNVNLSRDGGTVTIMGPEEQTSYPPFLCAGDETKSEAFTIRFGSAQ